MKRFLQGKHTLLWWINSISMILMCVCALVLMAFAGMSLKNLMNQEIENQKAILKLNIDNINENLSSLENYLLQTFSDSEEIVNIETSKDETKVFMARQSLTRSLKRIIGWNESLQILFCYSPDSMDKIFIRVSAEEGGFKQQKELGEQIQSYIDMRLKQNLFPGDGYLLTKVKNKGYVIRFYKIRNSYFGMCMDAETILRPLEELNSAQDCTAFLCNINGELIYASGEADKSVSITDNGKLLEREGEQYLQLNYLSKKGDFYIGTWTKVQAITSQIQGMSRLIIVFVFSVLLFMLGVSLLIRRALYRPIHDMEQSMKRVGNGEWDLVVRESSRILEYDSMIQNFNEMVSEIKNLKIQKYEKELDIQKLYLQYLQMQVNPHFYLNALNIIYSMAQVQNFEVLQEMTMSLVEYSRYMFREPGSLVTISQEMEHVDNYMKIQRLRFPDRIDYQVSMSSEIEDAMIPPFIIQSFVENSIKYAVNFEQHNVLSIHGKLNEIEDELYVQIEIRDNGTGYGQEILEMMNESISSKDGHQVGIRNVKARLALVFGADAKVILKNEDGAVTILLIPLTWQEVDEDE